VTTVGDDKEEYWSQTFPDDLVPQILEMVLSAWDAFIKPQPNAGEVETTLRFRKQLLQTSQLRNLPLRIDPEVELRDPVTNEVIGKLDLRLTTPRRVGDEVYFAFECKRLYATMPSGAVKSLAGEYVVLGMMRYASEQYAKSVSHGGMIGYVLNGKPSRAIKQVGKNIREKHGELRIVSPGELLNSRLVKSDLVFLTEHEIEPRRFQIHHVFLAR
jgi:hypothetical protein